MPSLRRQAPVVIKFPVPEPRQVIGLLPFEGEELLVRVHVQEGGGWSLVIFDPGTDVRLTRDLCAELSALRRGAAADRSARARPKLRGR